MAHLASALVRFVACPLGDTHPFGLYYTNGAGQRMPNGDLASVVLEAAKKERGLSLNDGQEPKNELSSNHQGANQPHHLNGHANKPSNGHLAPPFEWNSPNRAVSASPEPLDEDGTHALSKPAKKDVQRKQSPPNARKLSSSFRSNSTRRTSTASRDRRIYTSQSSNDLEDGETENAANHNAGQTEARGLDQETGRLLSSSVGQSGSSQPLRGPFSRMDSTRGQASLSSSRNGSGSSKQAPEVGRRKSTGGTDSRRPSMTVSATARRFVGFFTDGEQDEETQDEAGLSDDERRNRRLQPPGRQDTIQESASREGHTPNPTSSHGTPSRRVTSRANSYGFGRSQRSSRRNSITEAEEGEDTDRPNAANARPSMARGQTKARTKWDALRQRLKQDKNTAELDKGLTGSELVTDLSAGMMSVMMLKMAFDRDEHDKHRVCASYGLHRISR
jgi:phospholipase D1/2